MNEIENRIGKNVVMLQKQNQDYSTCYKCGLPWNKCQPKAIMYQDDKGCFAMCQYCWDNSSVDERIHHFKSLWFDHKNRWGASYDFDLVESEIIKQSSIDHYNKNKQHESTNN